MNAYDAASDGFGAAIREALDDGNLVKLAALRVALRYVQSLTAKATADGADPIYAAAALECAADLMASTARKVRMRLRIEAYQRRVRQSLNATDRHPAAARRPTPALLAVFGRESRAEARRLSSPRPQLVGAVAGRRSDSSASSPPPDDDDEHHVPLPTRLKVYVEHPGQLRYTPTSGRRVPPSYPALRSFAAIFGHLPEKQQRRAFRALPLRAQVALADESREFEARTRRA